MCRFDFIKNNLIKNDVKILCGYFPNVFIMN